MKGSTRLRLCLAAILAATSASVSAVRAEDTYSGLRMWDSGPYHVWAGVDADDTSLRIIGIIGATKGVSITYHVGSAPNVQYLSDHAEVTVPGTDAKHLTVINPPWADMITKCEMNGSSIWCYCTPQSSADCGQAGLLDGTANHTWYDF